MGAIKLMSKNRPKACNLSITLSCMLKCKVCYHWQKDETQIARPGIEDWKEFLSSVRKEIDKDFTVVFGGGEPLLLPDILIDLISFSSKLGFKTALATSGHTINQELAQRLYETGLNNIDLTIFSLEPKVHDFLRGTEGSLERVLKAVEYLGKLDKRLSIGINTIIMKPTLSTLLNLTDWVNNNSRLSGIYYQAITRPFHTPFIERWYEDERYSFLWPNDAKELEEVIDGIISRKNREFRIANPVAQMETFKQFFKNPELFVKKASCNLANGSFFAVNSDGTMTLCPYLDSLGKINEDSFSKLWNSEIAGQVMDKINHCAVNCHHLINCWFEEDNHE